MQKLLLSTLLFLSSCLMAQVSGIATLMGETNHSGIKVLFTAASPSAKTDSTYTDALGNYSKTLAAGTYKVTFSKRTFNTTPYPQNVFVNGVANLNPIELLDTVIKKVSGDVSGVWSKDTIYSIIDYCTIPSNDSLIVEPGVTISINTDRTSILGDGKLIMIGTKTDSIKIISESDQHFVLALNSITIKYVDSRVSNFSVNNYSYPNTTNSISNSKFIKLFTYFKGSSDIFNNKINSFFSFTMGEVNTLNIYCNVFNFDIDASLIQQPDQNSYSKVNVYDNIFNFNGIFGRLEFSFYMHIKNQSKIVWKNNYMNRLSGNIFIINEGAYLELSNNTFNLAETNTAINISGKSDQLHISNNIFDRMKLTTDIASPIFDFTKNQFSSGGQIPGNIIGAGIPLSTNAQGLNIDTYGNIIEAPKFTKIPLLAPDSPMLGTGVNGGNIGFYPTASCLEDYFHNWYVPKGPDSLSISGKVYATNVSLTNTLVKAVDTKTYKEYSTLTDHDGNFLLDSLPNGTYYIVTSPNPSMTGSYQTTYYPKKASLDQAEILSLESNIFDMKIYLVPSGPDAVDDLEFTSFAYPNPFKDELVIQKTNNERIIVTDITGRQMYTASEDKYHIDTHAWPAGIYMVKIQQKVLKFVKE